MDLSTLLRTVVRRWYVTVPALLLVLGAALSVVDSAEPEYSARRSVVLVRTGLLPPDAVVQLPDPSDPEADDEANEGGESDDAEDELEEPIPRNPYTEFNTSVTVTAEVLQEVAQSGEARRTLREAGLSDDYSVSVDENAPILEIEAIGPTPEVAIDTAERVAEVVTDDLEARQERFGVPEESLIVTDDVVTPDSTTRLDTARNRALIGIAVLGVVFVISVALAAELFARSRRGRQRRRDEADDPDVDPELDDQVSTNGEITDDGSERVAPQHAGAVWSETSTPPTRSAAGSTNGGGERRRSRTSGARPR